MNNLTQKCIVIPKCAFFNRESLCVKSQETRKEGLGSLLCNAQGLANRLSILGKTCHSFSSQLDF